MSVPIPPTENSPTANVQTAPTQTTDASLKPHAPTFPENNSDENLAALLDEPANQRWYRRPALWGGVALVLLIAAGVWVWLANDTANDAPTYTTQAAARGNLTLAVTANGTMQPTRTINIGSELSGTVLKVNVDVNDRIKKGQVLVELDTAKLRDQIKRSRASVSAANAKVAQTAATVKEASASLGRFEEVARLSGGKVPSKTELDSARASVERAKADAASANAGVTDAIAALSTDEINLSKASIVAPTDGVVLTRSVEPGNAVAASLQAVTLFSVAEDLAQLRLQVYVDEADVGTVAIGQKASFTVSAYSGRKYPAEITRVAFGSTITDNVVTYLTYLGVDNTDLSLRPGMTATATITATPRKDVLLVPNSALRFTPSMTSATASESSSASGDKGGSGTGKPAAKSGIVASLVPRIPRGNTRGSAPGGLSTAATRQVWVLRDAVAVAVAVVPGISDGRMTEIVSGDLEAGMLVITDQKSAPAK